MLPSSVFLETKVFVEVAAVILLRPQVIFGRVLLWRDALPRWTFGSAGKRQKDNQEEATAPHVDNCLSQILVTVLEGVGDEMNQHRIRLQRPADLFPISPRL